MSYDVTSLVSRKRIGSQIKKSVLLQMSSYASDDGSGIWASKSKIAIILEMSERSVQRAVKEMVQDRILIEVGQRKCKNGYTVDYSINLPALHVLEDLYSPLTHSHPCQSVTPTPDTQSPLPLTECHPNNNKNNNKNNNISSDDEFESYFEILYQDYPRKIGKGAARKALKAALKKTDIQNLFEKILAFSIEAEGKEERFIPHMATWLNQERWEDEQ